ncbi:MAG: four-helix bundle copper-binding protein [Candidatus Melainabacteria bacterium]|nr:four-helix bundle copper-binding protein [Candidatus Melainabacteria bacterium]
MKAISSKFLMFALMVLSFVSFVNVSPAFAGMPGMEACIKNCASCSTACDKALTAEQAKGKAASAELTKVLADCAAICKTSEGMLKRGSEFHPKVCKVCSEICAKCAELCEKSKDKALQDCAKECRKCEESCKKMAS